MGNLAEGYFSYSFLITEHIAVFAFQRTVVCDQDVEPGDHPISLIIICSPKDMESEKKPIEFCWIDPIIM